MFGRFRRVARRTARRTSRRSERRDDAQNEQSSDVTSQLKELASLHDQGILTDEEFATKKRRVLGI